MRPADYQDAIPAPERPNGVATQKRGRAARAPKTTAAAQALADFAAVETPAAEAQMWPVHAITWLGPDMLTAAPRSSGLRPQRRYRVPVPDFVAFPTAEPSLPSIQQQCEPLPPCMPDGIPACDRTPLGWDPRTVSAAPAETPE
jgi:hypothetical protein